MDNRDANIKCPFYRPGSKTPTTNRRVIGKRKRTIHCGTGEGVEWIGIAIEFRTVVDRVEYCRRFCKKNIAECKIAEFLRKKEEEER